MRTISYAAIATITTILILSACSSEPKIEFPEGLTVTDEVVGTGAVASERDFLVVHYTGYLESDGSVFDSSLERDEPIRFQLAVGMVIPGWDAGMEGMRAGGKRTLIIDSSLAYGEAGVPMLIPPDSDLRFEVELVDVIPEPTPWEVNDSELVETPEGLRYFIHSEGSGDAAEEGDVVEVFYAGFLDNESNELFDTSIRAGTNFFFELGARMVIPGWEIGVEGMRVGEERVLIIPPQLAYGEAGAGGGIIPPNATLIFNVRVEGIE